MNLELFCIALNERADYCVSVYGDRKGPGNI